MTQTGILEKQERIILSDLSGDLNGRRKSWECTETEYSMGREQ